MYKRTAVMTALLFLALTISLPFVKAADHPIASPDEGLDLFTSITFPGAAYTVANDVNQSGDIVGVYRMRSPVTHNLLPPRGFLLRNGAFSTIQHPGAKYTRAFGINNAGDIVGDYNSGVVMYGYLLPAGSDKFQTIQYSDDSFATWYTDAWDVDEQGHVTGVFELVEDDVVLDRAYIWQGGTFTRVMQTPFDDAVVTWTHGMNAKGEIVGCYWVLDNGGPDTVMHGLRVTPEGAYLSEDYPGSVRSMHYRISESSNIVGMYTDAQGGTHGYLYRNGDYTRIDVPHALVTQAFGIAERASRNPAGDPIAARDLLIVGTYVDARGVNHGYLLKLKGEVGQ